MAIGAAAHYRPARLQHATLLVVLMELAGPARAGERPLSELSLTELMNITVVTPTRHPEAASESPATVYVITEDEILRYGLRDLRDVLRLVPGVEWSYDQMTLQGGLRGFATNFSQTLLMINGREVESLIAAEPFISFQFQTFNVKQVEVVMGPASALYGANALVGVINIITKLNDVDMKNGGYVQQTVGSFATESTGAVFQHHFRDDVFVYAAANYFMTDNEDFGRFIANHYSQWRPPSDPFTSPTINPKYAYRNQARSISVEGHLNVRGVYAGVILLSNYTEGGLEEARPTFGERTLRRDELLWYAGFERQLLPKLRLKLEYLNFSEYDNDVFTFRDIAAQPISPGTNQGGGKLGSPEGYFGINGAAKHRADVQLEYRPWRGNMLIGGGTFEYYDLKSGPLDGSDFVLLPSSNADLTLTRDAAWNRFYKGGIYIQDQQHLFHRLDLTLGLRVDGHSYLGWTVNPRLGAVLHMWRGGSLQGSYASAFREPTIFELGTLGGNTLKAEKLQAAELGYRQKIWDLLFGVSGFFDRLADGILPNPHTPQQESENRFNFFESPGYSYGVEEITQLRRGRWQAFQSYAFVGREPFQDPSTGARSDAHGISQHKLMGGLSVSFFSDVLFISAYDVFNSGARVLIASDDGKGAIVTRLPDYNDLAVTIGVQHMKLFGIRFDATINIDNVINTDNWKPDERSIDPRAYPQNHVNALAMLRLHL